MVVLGGPQSVNDNTPAMRQQLKQIERALSLGIPYLGICLGMQALVKAAGGRVIPCPLPETGFLSPSGDPYRMALTETGAGDALFNELGQGFRVFQLHGETVEPAPGTELIGRGTECPHQAVKVGDSAYGLQCHFEMTPDMFHQWMEIDPSLKAMDRDKLFRQFDEVAEDYRATGLRLLDNFLAIAGFGKGGSNDRPAMHFKAERSRGKRRSGHLLDVARSAGATQPRTALCPNEGNGSPSAADCRLYAGHILYRRHIPPVPFYA